MHRSVHSQQPTPPREVASPGRPTGGLAGRLAALPRESVRRGALLASDSLAFLFALLLSLELGASDSRAPEQFLWSCALIPVWALLLKIYGLYDRDARRVSLSTVDDAPALFHAVLIAGLTNWLWLKAVPAEKMTLLQGVLFITITLVVVLLARSAVRRLVRVATPPEAVLFVGEGDAAGLLVRKVVSHPEYALEPVGYLAGDRGSGEELGEELPCLGEAGDLGAVCRERGVERVIISALSVEPEVLTDLIRDARDAEVKVSVLPHAFDVLGPATELDDVEGVTVLGINPAALSPSSRALKRALDVVASLPLLVGSLPLFPLIALAIKLNTRGPVFFSQERLGRGGRPFRLHKFRTMVEDAAPQAEELGAQSAHAVWLLLDEDPRVTRVGKFLRRTSLDELPQLWNVLRGEMSLVGPRPMPPAVHAHISGWAHRRLDLTPGLTGLWQVLGRTWLPFEEMIKLDYLYVTNWSLWGDVRLLLKTIHIVLSGRGAN